MEDKDSLPYRVNTMAVDDRATQGETASTTMVFTQFSRDIPASGQAGLICPYPHRLFSCLYAPFVRQYCIVDQTGVQCYYPQYIWMWVTPRLRKQTFCFSKILLNVTEKKRIPGSIDKNLGLNKTANIFQMPFSHAFSWRMLHKNFNRLIRSQVIIILYNNLGPLLLTWFNFNPSMDK